MSVRALPLAAPTQMSEPPFSLEPDSFAERLYLSLAPLAGQDEEFDWSLLTYCNAIGTMFQLVEELVRDSPDGPGWSMLLDLQRCPPEALAWLGQFVGVRIPSGLTEQQQRDWLAATDGMWRGTPAAMRAAAAATLTGSKTVLMYERAGDPVAAPIDYAYELVVNTYTSQTPNPTATLNALLAQKPAGIRLTYATVAGQTWRQLRDSGKTWQQVKDSYVSWDDVRQHQPT